MHNGDIHVPVRIIVMVNNGDLIAYPFIYGRFRPFVYAFEYYNRLNIESRCLLGRWFAVSSHLIFHCIQRLRLD